MNRLVSMGVFLHHAHFCDCLGMEAMRVKNSILTRLARIFHLLGWLYQTGKRLRSLDNATQEQRERALSEMGADCLKVLNVRVDVNRSQPENAQQRGLLVVANHVSWLDIFVISMLYPSSFIAMKEIRTWPVIGRMVSNAGAVYIDRSSRKDIDVINASISQVLEQNGNVCFFPEARTTLGNGILPLKAALFQAALNSNAPVQPLALRYYDEDVRTSAVSFAGVNLIRSLWQIVSIPHIKIKVDIGAHILPASLPEPDRFLMKDKVQEYLSPIVLSDSPAPELILPENAA